MERSTYEPSKPRLAWLSGFLLLLPAALGVTGFLLAGGCAVQDAMFRCLTMYVLNYGEKPPNLLVELARWTAPLATASGLLLALSRMQERLRAFLRRLRGDSVAVYGPEAERERLLAQLGRRGIRGGERLVKARRYILLDSEEENLRFYRRHSEALRGRRVYLRCEGLSPLAQPDEGVRLFSCEETAARLYWKTHSLYPALSAAGQETDVVLLGFGKLGEELLYWGLQYNVFSPEQRIRYHVFGDAAELLAVRWGLQQIGDPVLVHSEAWYESLELLAHAGRVLVLEQQDQGRLLNRLLTAVPQADITVFSNGSAAVEQLAQGNPICLFDWFGEATKPEGILEDRLYANAQALHRMYQDLYQGKSWEELDAFTRYSNVSAADYHEIRLQMLERLGYGGAACEALPEKTQTLLAELEHERWCRYHYLNNWRCGVPDNGANKDPVRRLHVDLKPFSALKDAEKKKDYDNLRLLLSRSGQM